MYHVSGKLSDGKPFSMRVNAPDAMTALSEVNKQLVAKELRASIAQAKPVAASNDLYVGEVKEKKAKPVAETPASETTATAATGRKR